VEQDIVSKSQARAYKSIFVIMPRSLEFRCFGMWDEAERLAAWITSS
jgi:hypothetical protein